MNGDRSDLARALIDIERYPIDDLAGATGRTLIKSCRKSLARTRFFSLPGFVTPEASALMAAQSEALLPESHLMDNRRTVYLAPEGADQAFSPEHPRNRGFHFQSRIVGCRWIPEAHAIRRLYRWAAMPRFLAATLDLPVLHHFDDPYQATTLLFHEEGQETPWHFDDNHEFTVTLLLQEPLGGGDFQLFPDIRSSREENYDALTQLLDGDDSGVVTVPRHVGELVVFRGKHSVHRVTPIRGAVPRIIAIMSFVDRPGLRAPVEVNRGAYGPRVSS